ncbi:Rrf2 family transcriptional regulator [Pseudokineococcus marinus]|uniref:Rrf2 family transcriptional regulator n=1 Tax=Pseudokineococcus marinus TaxID=351215 RepID=A0A849BVW4_9ACTN|nr:Rrf2 family transcriptional regulator [Pseudokineococcus marinus]NNH21698.1 Rrf2 family transcriptional regulator [Pseudokineococcus marinus]
MRLTAKTDYALRAVCQLASRPGGATSDHISEAEAVPQRFLEAILRDLRRAGLVTSRRGPDGGHALAVDPEELTVADVIRAIDGPLALVRNLRPEQLDYRGASVALQDVWVALRASERAILEATTVAMVVRDQLPDVVVDHLPDRRPPYEVGMDI